MKASRIALLDLFSGISGDMLMGALLDLGVDKESFTNTLRRLDLPGFDLRVEKVMKKGLSCTKAIVIVDEEHHVHRKLADVEAIVRGGSLPQEVVDKALEAFGRIARAEGKVHGKPPEEIHFHEVGALDAVVDVCGGLLAAHMLGIEKFYATSVSVGTGTIKAAHGVLPVPCPASVEILGDFPIVPTGIRQEMVTPTGAALLRTLVQEPALPPTMRAESIGYGAGTRDIEGRANAVRIIMGQTDIPEPHQVSIVETNIDDMNPEVYGYLLERLLESGALDAFLTPIIGKKNRPAVLVTALCPQECEGAVADVLLMETTSLGVRTHRGFRSCVKREQESVQTRWGEVGVKVAHYGSRSKAAPEYEDCKAIAREHGVALLEVYEEVRRNYGKHQ